MLVGYLTHKGRVFLNVVEFSNHLVIAGICLLCLGGGGLVPSLLSDRAAHWYHWESIFCMKSLDIKTQRVRTATGKTPSGDRAATAHCRGHN